MATILIGVTGSIAAYKACELARLLVKEDHEVHVIMTQCAQKFVTPLTFQTLSRNPVAESMFAEPEDWIPGHISLADKAELLVIAPCTANVIAKLAHGLADDMLTATALATRAPILIAPAMNTGMWDNPATQANIALLKSRGVRMVDAGTGDLACGTTGKGRMAEPEQIVQAVAQLLKG
ncbi:MAG: bifunctional phosphopantothenoylcysteine decarboxylase/phosphopantothenate--cysteine ligase CoaBC [bacterium]